MNTNNTNDTNLMNTDFLSLHPIYLWLFAKCTVEKFVIKVHKFLF